MRRFDHANRRWKTGQMSEPAMPATGLRMPMSTSEVAGMFSEVFAKSIAVDVIVVKPVPTMSAKPNEKASGRQTVREEEPGR